MFAAECFPKDMFHFMDTIIIAYYINSHPSCLKVFLKKDTHLHQHQQMFDSENIILQ